MRAFRRLWMHEYWFDEHPLKIRKRIKVNLWSHRDKGNAPFKLFCLYPHRTLEALNELLGIYNLSFLHLHCPKIWRIATIVPLLKSGKPASKVASFRLVSLTSWIAILTERIIANRLYHIAETSNRFIKLQAGSRKGMSCEDNITRIIQKIMDGFDQEPWTHRSVLLLLDFNKAYDTVWREKLLLSMLRQTSQSEPTRSSKQELYLQAGPSPRIRLCTFAISVLHQQSRRELAKWRHFSIVHGRCNDSGNSIPLIQRAAKSAHFEVQNRKRRQRSMSSRSGAWSGRSHWTQASPRCPPFLGTPKTPKPDQPS